MAIACIVGGVLVVLVLHLERKYPSKPEFPFQLYLKIVLPGEKTEYNSNQFPYKGSSFLLRE